MPTPILKRLEKMLERERDVRYNAERSGREARAQKKFEREHALYSQFCERMIRAGAKRDRLPTFDQWKGRS